MTKGRERQPTLPFLFMLTLDELTSACRFCSGRLYLSYPESEYLAMRRIRNRLESFGFHPQSFRPAFCDEALADAMLQREIEAHTVFLILEPADPTSLSCYERRERSYIAAKEKALRLQIPLGHDEWELWNHLDRIRSHLCFSVFSSKADEAYRHRMNRILEQHQLLVDTAGIEEQIPDTVEQSLRSPLMDAAEKGTVLLLISQHMRPESMLLREAVYAKTAGLPVIPIFLGRPPLPQAVYYTFELREFYRLAAAPTDKALSCVVDRILQNVERLQANDWIERPKRCIRME